MKGVTKWPGQGAVGSKEWVGAAEGIDLPSALVLAPSTGQTQLEARGKGSPFLQPQASLQGTEQGVGWVWRGKPNTQRGLAASGQHPPGHLHVGRPVCRCAGVLPRTSCVPAGAFLQKALLCARVGSCSDLRSGVWYSSVEVSNFPGGRDA